jgi:Lar family restriction alleviation protein
MTDLKPCPFCGGEPLVITSRDDASSRGFGDGEIPEYFWVQCKNMACGTEGPSVQSREDAAKAWNPRPEEERLRAENASLKSDQSAESHAFAAVLFEAMVEARREERERAARMVEDWIRNPKWRLDTLATKIREGI